jgi:pimeloyl-ACP methyl ester carboxylesterase
MFSERPEGGYDKKTMAKDNRELVHQLGFDEGRIVGHDIGLMVAYAYAAEYHAWGQGSSTSKTSNSMRRTLRRCQQRG